MNRHIKLTLTLKTDTSKRTDVGRYRKILVAVDSSDSAKNAFRQACRIVREDKSWITVITTIPIYPDQFDVLSIKEKVSRRLREEGGEIISGIMEIANQEDVYIQTRIEEGAPFQTIIDIAEEGGYDLIVMGRHGISRLERALVGSVTARVIGHSRRDVLVVPGNTAIGWKTIVLATDGSRYSTAAREKAINLAHSYGGAIKAVSVVDITDEFYTQAPELLENLIKEAKGFVENIRQKAEDSDVKVETLVREGETYRVITDLAKKEGADVIVMGSHGRTGVKRLLMGSVTEKVIGYAACPVLVVKV